MRAIALAELQVPSKQIKQAGKTKQKIEIYTTKWCLFIYDQKY